MGCCKRGCSIERANRAGCNLQTRSTKRSRAVRNSPRICINSRALWLASWVFRLLKSALVSVSLPARKSSTRAIHRDSRSSRWPVCSWTDHLFPGLPSNTSSDTPRNCSSSLAGVPRRRTQRLGYCSTGKVKLNFRSNQTGTWLIEDVYQISIPFEITSLPVVRRAKGRPTGRPGNFRNSLHNIFTLIT